MSVEKNKNSFFLMICSITHFRNRIPGYNYPGTQSQFQLLSKKKRQCNEK